MKIILHPGLHKTGTTSIQMFLRSAFGSAEPERIWYPMTPILSPGHSSLPYSLRREHLRDKGFAILRDYVERAAMNGTEVLVISAEDIGWLESGILVRMKEGIGNHFLQLVFTLSPYKARAVSLWQENVKHGETPPIREADNLLNPKLDPGLVSRVTEALAPDDNIAILGSKSHAPDWLIRTFLDGCDLQRYIDSSRTGLNYSIAVNRSFGKVEVEVIRHLNMCFGYLRSRGIDLNEAYIRKRITSCLTSARWKAEVPRITIECPETWETQVSKQAFEARRDIEKLLESGRIKVLGDLDSLVEGVSRQ